MKMQQKTVLITGSSKGLGTELARVFASAGWNILLHGRDESDLQAVKKELLALSIESDIVQGDIREVTTLNALEAAARKHSIDVLINNAGIGLKLPLEKLRDEQIHEMLETNLVATIKLTHRIYRFFVERKAGTIININSMSGKEPHYLRTIYCASKWGLRGFAESLKREAKEHNIHILDVYPTRIKTSPAYLEGMETKDVAQKIYAAFADKSLSELIIDERLKK